MQLKKLFNIVLLFISCNFCAAQVLSVTAAITDADSQSWNNGNWSVQLYSPNGTAYYNGALVPTAIQSGSLSANGTLSVNLYNTNTITPTGAMYSWTICSYTSAPCATFNTPVTATNLSSVLSSLVTAPRFSASPTAYGYLDAEITPIPPPGGSYYNVSNNVLRVWNGTTWGNGGSTAPVFPTNVGQVAHYQFLEGSGNIYHDSSGSNFCSGPCDVTVISGVPAGTSAPPWITSSNGKGVGVAMGSSPNGYYGLPTNNIGTSCETFPILQNQVRTIAFQYYNLPAMEVYGTSWSQPWIIGTSGTSTGLQFNFYGGGQLLYSNRAGGNSAWAIDNFIGIHDVVVSYPVGGPVVVYLDGIKSNNLIANSAYATTATNFVLGCSAGANGSPSSELYIFDVLFGSNTAAPQDAQQYHAAVQYSLNITKAYNDVIQPILSGSGNQFLAVGDSTTNGTQGSGITVTPYAACLKTGTVNCYSTSYTTALSNVNNQPWIVNWFAQPGAGYGFLIPLADARDNKVFGFSNSLHVAVNWTGINGLVSTQPSSCAWAQSVIARGWDAWLMPLVSQGNAATDQASRDIYNNRILTVASACKYKVVNIAEDAFIGKDGQCGTAPYWSGTCGVHPQNVGYAYIASIISRVMNNYYNANMNQATVYSAATVTMNGPDRNVIWDTSSNAIAATLPDCIGMGGTGISYLMTVRGANSVTLSPAVVSGQTETVNLTTSLVIPTGVYKFQPQTYNTSSSAPGGCDWQRMP